MPRTTKKHPQTEKTAGTLLVIREDESQTSKLACCLLVVMAISIQMIQL